MALSGGAVGGGELLSVALKHNRGRIGANGKIPHQWREKVCMWVCVKAFVSIF